MEKKVGKISIQSADHIGVILYDTFTASIASTKIDQAVWKFNGQHWVNRHNKTLLGKSTSNEDLKIKFKVEK